MKYWPHWASHYPLLIKIMQMTSGDVLELGMGMASTPLLHWFCFDMGRNLFSYEENKKYFDMHIRFHRPYHKIHFVEDWDKIDINKAWSVALIDHGHKRRREELKKLANCCEYVIVHDTQPEDDKLYGVQSVFRRRFKYRYDYTKIKPYTTVVSNFVNLQEVLK